MGKMPFLRITSDGNLESNPRKEVRLTFGGIVFLHVDGKKSIRARARDLSLNGIGIDISEKLKSYRLNSVLRLEFAQPHPLQGLLIKVELKRVNTNYNGSNQCGFSIVSNNRLLKEKLFKLIGYIEHDPWKGSGI